jgi:hypothetical protein
MMFHDPSPIAHLPSALFSSLPSVQKSADEKKTKTLIPGVDVLSFEKGSSEAEPIPVQEGDDPEIVEMTSKRPRVVDVDKKEGTDESHEEKKLSLEKAKVTERSIFFAAAKEYIDKLRTHIAGGHGDVTSELPAAMQSISWIRTIAYEDRQSCCASGRTEDWEYAEMARQDDTQNASKKELADLSDIVKVLKAMLSERLRAREGHPASHSEKVEDSVCKLAVGMLEDTICGPSVALA